MNELLERLFGLKGRDTTWSREVLGGVTTFMALSYVIFVQPAILANAGMPKGGVLVAMCVASAIACVLMGLPADYPIALAPAMGHNVFFASYSLLKLVTGRAREVHWGFHLVSVALLLRYIFLFS